MKKIVAFVVILLPLVYGGTVANVEPIKESEYSRHELELLAKVVEAEARGESFRGKYLVASTVINRVNDSRFPTSIAEVVEWPNQYATPSSSYSEESMQAVEKAIGNPYPSILYFYNPKKATNRNFTSRLRKCIVVGNHRFCKDFNN